jgi:flagellar export protein FliJ
MPPAFSLQPVLNYREHRVEMLQLELARLFAVEADLRMQLDEKRQFEQSILSSLAHAVLGLLDLTTIGQLHVQLRSTQNQIAQLEKHLAEVAVQTEFKRAEVVKAEQSKETLAKIKSNGDMRWQDEMVRREASDRDDQYIARAYRMAREA